VLLVVAFATIAVEGGDMKRAIIFTVFIFALTDIIGYNVHSQLVPRPLHPFFVFVAQTSLRFQPAVPVVYGRGYAVREDGSWVEIYQPNLNKETQLDTMRTIWDFAAMKKTIVYDTAESTSSYGIPHHDVARSKIVPKAHCGSSAGQLLGYDVEYRESDTPLYIYVKGGPDREIKNREKFWEAPALGCYPLRHEQYATMDDGSEAINAIWTAMYVTEGDVSKYFEIPPNYVERSPSEIDAEIARKYPEITPTADPNSDAVYRSGQRLLQHPEQ
jgi:hypothetical protein